MADKKYTLPEVESVVKEFVSILDEIYRHESIRFNWRDIMFNRSSFGSNRLPKNSTQGLLYRHHKRFIAFAKVVRLYPLIAQSLEEFGQEKGKIATQIESYDLELSKRLQSFNVPSQLEFEWLKPIAQKLNENPDEAISYIATPPHYQEIINKLRVFKDVETAYKLRRIILLLGEEEVAELNKCINDIRRWPNYRLTNRIDFFTQRLMLYLKGGRDEVSGETYRGIASHFKDADLARQIFGVSQIKKLWTYKEEMQFFSWARQVVTRALREPRWEGFYEFYNNLRRGKNYIKMVGDKFGNLEFADFLKRLHEKKQEAPEIWERDLEELNYRLNNPTYQNMSVIEPARRALITIFNARINQLLVERNDAVRELQSLLNERIKELQNAEITVRNKFVKMLKKHRSKLLRQWENEKREYERKEDAALLPLVNFAKRCEIVLGRIDRRKKYIKYKKVLNYSLKGNLYLYHLFEKMITNENKELLLERLEGPLYYALYKRYELAMAEDDSYDEIETLEESDVQELRDLITVGRKIILARLDKLLDYVYDKVNQHFLPETKKALQQYASPETEQFREAA